MSNKLDPINCKDSLAIHKDSGKLVVLYLVACNTNCIFSTLFEVNAYEYYTQEPVDTGIALDSLIYEFEFTNAESLQWLLIQADNYAKLKLKENGNDEN